MKKIYIVLSQTRSIVSKLIQLATGDPFTHASISFGEEPEVMYSFGRVFPHNPVWGGFVRESVSFGTMMRFRDAEVAVVCVPVNDEEYEQIRSCVHSMYGRRRQYGYNYIGLVCAKFGITYRWQNHYYCSEFIKEILEKFGVASEGELSDIVRPVEFLKLRRGKLIYRGRLCRFSAACR